MFLSKGECVEKTKSQRLPAPLVVRHACLLMLELLEAFKVSPATHHHWRLPVGMECDIYEPLPVHWKNRHCTIEAKCSRTSCCWLTVCSRTATHPQAKGLATNEPNQSSCRVFRLLLLDSWLTPPSLLKGSRSYMYREY